MTKVCVQIFGQQYTLAGEGDPEYALQLAQYVDGKMREVGQAGAAQAPTQIAILAAIRIADDLFHLRRQLQDQGETLTRLDRRAKDLIETIEEEFEDLKLE